MRLRATTGLALAALVAVVTSLFLFCACCRPAHAEPEVSATLAVGAAQSGPELLALRGGSTAPMAELKLAVRGADLGFKAEVRHAFRDDGYFHKKSRVKLGADLNLAPGTAFFVEAQRSYRTGDEWGWCGLRFDLGKL